MNPNDNLVLWLKQKEIEMLREAGFDDKRSDYFGGKAQAFSEVWELLVFRGREPHPTEYNRENEKWSELVGASQAEEVWRE